jgi:membrane-bound lytic murein transglycosylase D
LAIILLLQFSAQALGADLPVRERNPGFVIPPELKTQVEFWKRIYGEYGTHQSVIHDSRYIDLIYEVITARSGESPRETSRRGREARQKWRNVLLSLHRKQVSQPGSELSPAGLSEDEKHVYELFTNVRDPGKFLAASHRRRLRSQLGQKDRFEEGYRVSGRYLQHLEEVFQRESLPWELTRLPFVESSFNLRARSKVGASGIWQFMRSTGRLYLTIRPDLDERNDPIRAAEAAAKLFKTNYEALGNWPLAVTAYNHGRMGLMRAVRQVSSSNLGDIISAYRSRSFGFASSNFFACLLAAIEVERNAVTYFGEVKRDSALQFVEVSLPRPTRLRDLIWYFHWRLEDLEGLNPAISRGYWKGLQRLPAGYRLRIPPKSDTSVEGQVQLFLAGYDTLESALAHPRKGLTKP